MNNLLLNMVLKHCLKVRSCISFGGVFKYNFIDSDFTIGVIKRKGETIVSLYNGKNVCIDQVTSF